MTIKSGRYEGSSSNYSFQVRLDFDEDQAVGVGQLSGDMFEGQASEPAAFQCSFASIGPPTVSPDEKRLEAPLAFQGPRVDPWTASGRIVCERVADQAFQTTLTIFSDREVIWATYAFRLDFRSAFFRTVEYQLDLYGVDDPQRLGALFPKVRANLARAGIQLLGNEFGRVVEETPSSHRWSESDLYSAMNSADFFNTSHSAESLRWRMYLMVVPHLRSDEDDGIVTGMMFDHKKDQFPRQGTAVSWKVYSDLNPAEFERNFVRTFTHEIGHTLNLLHTFDVGKRFRPKLASTSYMNYPRYHVSGESAYWDAYGTLGRFDPDELLFMRHAHLETVIMGGTPLGTGGHDKMASLSKQQSRDGLRLELYLTPLKRSPLLEFGEPVHVEAKLKDYSGEERFAADVLDPGHRRTLYFIHRPDGRTVRFEPLLTRCSSKRQVLLSPESRPAIYEDIQLSYGAQDFYFLDPGRYQIQALYTGTSPPLRSNVLDLWVRYPDRETEELVVPTFTKDVSAYLATWGNRSLANAESLLQSLTEQSVRRNRSGTRPRRVPGTRPLVDAFFRCRFQAAARMQQQIDYDREEQQMKVTVVPPDPETAVKDLAKGIGLPPEQLYCEFDKTLPHLSNILFGFLGGSLIISLRLQQNPQGANEVAAAVERRLAVEKAPAFVKKRYRRKWKLDNPDEEG